MALRIAIFTLMAVGLLGFGAVAWISTWPSTPDPAPVEEARPVQPIVQAPPPPSKIAVLVASHALRGGSFVKSDDLRGQDVATDQVPQGATIDTPAARSQMNGAMIRHGLSESQVVLSNDVLRPGDHGFLAAVLEPGMRAMTFSLTDVTTDWALIWPGDHLDLILTQQFDDTSTGPRHRIAAETIIRDARVVAVDRQLVQGEMAEDSEHKGTRTLTIEVTQTDSEHLAVAQRLGKITLAVRSAAPMVDAALTPGGALPVRMSDASHGVAPSLVTWGGDVAHSLDQPPPPEPSVVRVFRGSEDGKEFKF